MLAMPKQSVLSAALLTLLLLTQLQEESKASKLTSTIVNPASILLLSDPDSISTSLKIVKASYHKIPEPGEDPLLHLEYTTYSSCQVRPLDFAAYVTNLDTTIITGVYLEIDYSNSSGSETFFSDSLSIAPGDTAALVVYDFIPPQVTGSHTIHYTIHSDQPSDSIPPTTSRTFNINSFADIYLGDSQLLVFEFLSRDQPQAIAYTTDMGSGSVFEVGMVYSFTENDQICCLGAHFGSNTSQNTLVVLDIFMWTSYGLDFVAGTDIFYPYAGQIWSPGAYHWESLFSLFGGNFTMPVFPGDQMVVKARLFNTDEDLMEVGISSHDAADSSAYIFGQFDDMDCTSGCFTNDVYMIRVGMSEAFCVTQVSEIAENIAEFKCVPNPTQGPFEVQYTLLDDADIELYLFDSVGRIVIQQNEGRQAPGQYIINMNSTGIAPGMYNLTIVSGGKVQSKKVVFQ